MQPSRVASVSRAQFARLRMPVRRMQSRWRSRVTGWSEATARSPATAGASSASARCSRGRPRYDGFVEDRSGGAGRAIGEERVAQFDWAAVAGDLNGYGCAVPEHPLSVGGCRLFAGLDPAEAG